MNVVRKHLKTEFFTVEYHSIIEKAFAYYDQYNDAPLNTKHIVFKDSNIGITHTYDINTPDFEIEIEFIKYITTFIYVEFYVQQQRKAAQSFDDKALKSATAALADLPDFNGSDSFSTKNSSSMFSVLHEKYETQSTGYKCLDESVGEFEAGRMTIYCAPSGVGKSLFLMNHAINALFNNKNVMFVSIENSDRETAMRFTKMFLNMHDTDIEKLSEQELYDAYEKVRTDNNITANIFFEKLDVSATTQDIKKRVDALVKSNELDLIIVDYIDIIQPHRFVDINNVSLKDKAVSEELRAIADKSGKHLITASQLVRGANQAEELGHEHIAGGITKINTADLVLGIRQTKEMFQIGEFEVTVLKSRNSASTHKVLRFKLDKKSLRISDPLDTAQVTPTATTAPLSRLDQLRLNALTQKI
jgi:replicative DNA helicase